MRVRAHIAIVSLALVTAAHAADVVAGSPAASDGGMLDAALPPDPDAPTVGVSIDRSEAALGDKLTLTISSTSKEGMVVTLPNAIELGKFEILSRDDGDPAGLDVGNGRRARRFVLGIASYEIGTHAIPEIRLSYIGADGRVRSVDTEPLLITIAGVIGENEKPEPQPLRPVRSTMIEDLRAKKALQYGAIVLGVLFVIALIRVLLGRLMRRRAEAAAVAAPPRPADEIALERLAALRAKGHFYLDSFRPYYFELSEILREFLGGRFKFYALELTTSELLVVLGDQAPDLAKPDGEIAKFFEESDLVKFAKYGSDEESAERAFAFVETIVKKHAKPAEAPSSSSSPPAAPAAPGAPDAT